ncbi:hypothetical protein AP064_05535 [Candidatus Liberibacter solanacearum]|uniref:Uncharacterized protein n=1 Tax=Candidatus Liberibacter solanacearum TaxID=556287 RepID=A0A0F4VJL6_9HYPH|nr:hypothetical protein [Candidatus Liberibacter solanacearum]KJZ81584.1 hypothetical protein DJ66_0306 [Candidatus Liberibacter solanacearum]KQC48681.1 hypothetical protein AP064_05535 [Candidatus Liberibacter solanacearum]
MIELNLKKPSVESIAPNQDAVRDAVNPARGLQDVSVAIEQATKTLETLRRATVFADANTQFTRVSAEADKSFMNYTNSLDTSNTPQAGDKINAYVEGTLRKNYDNFISTIPNREVRQHFQAQVEHELRDYQKKGLEIQIGASVKRVEENLITSRNNLVNKIHIDSSDESYLRHMGSMENQINSLPIPLDKKQTYLNESRRVLSREKVITEYSKDPNKFAKYINVSITNSSKPSDPTSIASLGESAGDKELSVADDLKGSIDDAAWDKLDTIERRHLLEHLTGGDNKANNKRKREFIADAKRSEALLDKGIVHPDVYKLTAERAMDALGSDKGVELYDLIDFKIKSAPSVSAIKTMTTTEAETFLAEVHSKGIELGNSPDYMYRYKLYYDHLAKAHKESMDLLQKDPVKWAVENKVINPLRFDDLDNMGSDLSLRVTHIKQIDKKFGLNSSVFSKDDETLFLKKLKGSNSHEFIKDMSRVWDGTNEADKDKVLYSYNKIDDPALSSILTFTTQNDPTAKEVASTIAVGAKHRKDIETNFKTESKVGFKDAYSSRIRKRVGELYSNGESTFDTTGKFLGAEKEAQALELYILGDMHKSGDYSRKANERIDKALKAALGGASILVNGCKLRPIRGMGVDEYQDTLHALTSSVLESKGWKDGAKLPETYGYANVSEGEVMLMFKRYPKLDDQGNVTILDMKNLPSEHIVEMAKKRREYLEQKRLILGMMR